MSSTKGGKKNADSLSSSTCTWISLAYHISFLSSSVEKQWANGRLKIGHLLTPSAVYATIYSARQEAYNHVVLNSDWIAGCSASWCRRSDSILTTNDHWRRLCLFDCLLPFGCCTLHHFPLHWNVLAIVYSNANERSLGLFFASNSCWAPGPTHRLAGALVRI